MPLLSTSQLAAVRNYAKLGMITSVVIKRRGLADNVYEDAGTVSYSTVVTVNGWFYSRVTPTPENDIGSLTTVNTYRLYVPVGTNVLAGDLAVVGSVEYVVTDTTAESTWLPLLTVSLRKRE